MCRASTSATRTAVVLLSFLMAVTSSAESQTPKEDARAMAALSSSVMKERVVAVEHFLASPPALKNPAVATALVNVLEKENGLVAEAFRRGTGSAQYGEGYSEYYSRLLAAVAENADLGDDRTLRIVAAGAYNPDSRLAFSIADAAGARLVPIANELLKSDLVGNKWNALGLLGRVYEKRSVHGISPALASDIKRTITSAAEDKATRRHAVQLLGRVGTAEDLPLLQSIAKTDTESRVHAARGRIYPVRELAEKAVLNIQARKQIP